MSRRICLALDLVDEPAAIAEYERWHQPGHTVAAVIQSIRDAGITNMEIYRAGTRLFMIIDATDHYSPDDKAQTDAANPAVQDWIALMAPFQRPVPSAGPDGTWIEMDRIFALGQHAGLDQAGG
jgi:L-rhamnose mutarotase